MLIYPTNARKQGSNNGFSILEKLSLANLRIDHVNHAVTAIDNRGEVQLRVNGVVVGKQEMLALDPKDVVKIDFINNPGVRYGEGGENGAFPPTRDGCIHSLSMRERG